MDSNLLARIHGISVMLFLLTYLIKTILLFTSKEMLNKYSKATKVPEMIISTAFLVTGIWLFVILGGIKMLHIIKLVLVFLSIPIAVIGFKKQNKGLALFALLLIIGAYGLAEASKNKPFLKANVVINGDASDATKLGAKVYMENCVFCHGENGKKMYRGAKDLSVSLFGVDDVQQMVREGSKGKMPAYNIILSDENIAAVSAYVQSLKAPQPAAE
jgi:mono/diheme cytochrome c family protein